MSSFNDRLIGAAKLDVKIYEEVEADRGAWNSRWSGEMRRYLGERLWRKRSTGPVLTLRRESVGSERD